MNYRNKPEALLYGHMTSKVPLKDLLTGKVPYYLYTTLIYAHRERQSNDLNLTLAEKNVPARVLCADWKVSVNNVCLIEVLWWFNWKSGEAEGMDIKRLLYFLLPIHTAARNVFWKQWYQSSEVTVCYTAAILRPCWLSLCLDWRLGWFLLIISLDFCLLCSSMQCLSEISYQFTAPGAPVSTGNKAAWTLIHVQRAQRQQERSHCSIYQAFLCLPPSETSQQIPVDTVPDMDFCFQTIWCQQTINQMLCELCNLPQLLSQSA